MQDNVQKEEGGVSLLEIFRLLLSKIKLLILVVLVAGIAGGAFALYTSWNDLHFGTKVEFYVNPEKPKENAGENASQFGVYGAYGRHVMDNMVKLLESESFTEQLLLNGEKLPRLEFKAGETDPLGNVVPEGRAWRWITDVESDAYIAFKTALADAQIARNNANDPQILNEFNKAVAEKTEQTKSSNDISNELNKEWMSLYLAEQEPIASSSFSQETYDTIASQYDAEDKNQPFYRLMLLYSKKTDADNRVIAAQEKIDDYNVRYLQKADDLEKEALELWRASAGYKAVLKMYSAAVSYSYLEANADIDDANNLARSFIYVSISVVGEQNQDFAKEVHKRVKDIVPTFVKENMTVPTDYLGTNCERITRTDEIHRTNPNHRTTQVIKYGLLFGAAALVVAAVIIIIVDKSDKRLRDTEVITKKFNVPILGVVPSIEELHEEAHAKKIGANKKTKEAK